VREVPQAKFRGWEPPSYRVDERGKVEGATPGEPNNWGRWGDDDQRGTLNLLTPDRVAQAAALVRTGERFPLGLPIGGVPTPSHRPPVSHLFSNVAGDYVLGDAPAGLQTSDDYVMMALQASTQVDGFGHFGGDGFMYNGFWAGLVSARSGARRLGVHHFGDGFVGRGVLLDVARHVGVERLDPMFRVGPALLEATAGAQGVEVRSGDLLLVRTGWLGWWLAQDDKTDPVRDEPGVSAKAVPWIAERDVALLATDTTAVEVMAPEEGERPLALHVAALRDLGMPLGEMFDVDALAAACASDGVWEFFLSIGVLPVVNGVGSPVNPIAVR